MTVLEGTVISYTCERLRISMKTVKSIINCIFDYSLEMSRPNIDFFAQSKATNTRFRNENKLTVGDRPLA